MKKILALLAGLFVSSIALAGADITLGPGDIEDVVIGNVWSVDVWVAEWRAGSAAAGDTPNNPTADPEDYEYDDVITRGGDDGVVLGVGGYFGSVDVTGDGIMVDDNGTADESDDILFRGGDRYTTTTFYVGNNEEEEWKIYGTVTGSLLSLTPADEDTVNSSVVNALNMLSFDGDNPTNVPANVVNEDVMYPIFDGVDFDVYIEATANSMIGDTVTNMLFLNYLHIDTPAGTYNGSVTWVLTATV